MANILECDLCGENHDVSDCPEILEAAEILGFSLVKDGQFPCTICGYPVSRQSDGWACCHRCGEEFE